MAGINSSGPRPGSLLFGLLLLISGGGVYYGPSSVSPQFQNESEVEPPEDPAGATSRLNDWKEKLSSEKRPRRQEAARKLVRHGSTQSKDFVVRTLAGATKREKEALLTGIANGVSAKESSVEHLLKPLLRRYARSFGDGGTALIEAASYYPGEKILSTIETLLIEEPNGGNPQRLLLQKSRLVRLLGGTKIDTDPIRTGRLLITLTRTLPDELYSDLVTAFRENFHVYSLSSVEECRTWWKEHKDASPEQLYRDIARKTSRQALGNWKDVVRKLFSAHGTGSAKLYANLLTTPDPRKIQFILKHLRQTPPEKDRSRLGKQISALLSRGYPATVQRDTLATIEQLQLEETRSSVEKRLSSFRPSVRAAAASALGAVGNETSAKRLTERFRLEQNASVTESLVQAIQELNYRKAVPAFKKRLLQPGSISSSVQSAIVQALGALGTRQSLDGLTTFLEETDPENDEDLRFDLAYSIGQIQHPRGVPPLVRLTNDPQSSVRGSAAQALGNISFDRETDADVASLRQKAVDALFRLLGDSDQDTTVRRRAANSIASIGTASSIPRLTELTLEQQDNQNTYRRDTLVTLLKKFPEQLAETVSTLLDNDRAALVTHIDGQFSPDKLKPLADETNTLLRVLFARAHLAMRNWSRVITHLKNIGSVEAVDKNRIKLIRIEAYLGIGNLAEARKRIETMLENAEKTSSLWWKLQALRVRRHYQQPPPRSSLKRIDKLLNQSPPSDVAAELKRIRKDYKTNVKTIEQALNKLFSNDDPSAVQEPLNTLVDLTPFHPHIVRSALDRIPMDPDRALETVTPPVARLLSKITGTERKLSGDASPDQVKDARADWSAWLKNRNGNEEKK